MFITERGKIKTKALQSKINNPKRKHSFLVLISHSVYLSACISASLADLQYKIIKTRGQMHKFCVDSRLNCVYAQKTTARTRILFIKPDVRLSLSYKFESLWKWASFQLPQLSLHWWGNALQHLLITILPLPTTHETSQLGEQKKRHLINSIRAAVAIYSACTTNFSLINV